MRLDAGGGLAVEVAGGALVQRRPVAYQDVDGRRRPVDARYVARGDDRFGVAVGDYDRRRPLVIDPVLVYSTFLGGSNIEEAFDVKVDATGAAYITGYTASAGFPTANAISASPRGGTDIVVAKLNPADTALVYSTYLGGGGDDYGLAIAIDGTGAAYVAGRTASGFDFPLVSPAQAVHGGGAADAFVVKLSPSGSAVAYSTFLGGSGDESATGIALDGAGNMYVAGTTTSTNFPIAQALQATNRGEEDAFVARLSPAGALVYATYLGGSAEDYGADVDVDPSGNAVVVGTTESGDFPTAQPLQGSSRGYSDAFVTRLSPSGSALLYSTYLGGTANDKGYGYAREGASAVAVDASGNAYLTGLTESSDFPTKIALSPTSGNGYDAFVTKVGPAGALVYSTYMGSDKASESGEDIAVDGAGNAHVAGISAGQMPEKDSIQARRDWHDAFVSKLDASGAALLFSTNLGGDSDDWGRGVAVDGSGNIYLVGQTQHTLGIDGQPMGEAFPTKNPIQAPAQGGLDMFVAKISVAPPPPPVIAGSTWHSDGSKSRSGPAGSEVVAYAVGGLQGVPYRLVLGSAGDCATTVAVLNTNLVRAGPSGLIGTVRGLIPLGTPPGTYSVCFRHDGGTTATGVVTFVVQ